MSGASNFVVLSTVHKHDESCDKDFIIGRLEKERSFVATRKAVRRMFVIEVNEVQCLTDSDLSSADGKHHDICPVARDFAYNKVN